MRQNPQRTNRSLPRACSFTTCAFVAAHVLIQHQSALCLMVRKPLALLFDFAQPADFASSQSQETGNNSLVTGSSDANVSPPLAHFGSGRFMCRLGHIKYDTNPLVSRVVTLTPYLSLLLSLSACTILKHSYCDAPITATRRKSVQPVGQHKEPRRAKACSGVSCTSFTDHHRKTFEEKTNATHTHTLFSGIKVRSSSWSRGDGGGGSRGEQKRVDLPQQPGQG